MLYRFRFLVLFGLLIAAAPGLRAQISPFADPSDFLRYSCPATRILYPSYLNYPGCPNDWSYGPSRAYYQQSYCKRHHGVHGYTSIREAQLAYRREGLPALDGLKLAAGMKVGHGGKVQVPGVGFVRPAVDRPTGRLALPAAAVRQSALIAARSGGASGAEGGAYRGAGAAGSVAHSTGMAPSAGASGMSHGGMSGAAGGGGSHR